MSDQNLILLAHRICMWKALQSAAAVCEEIRNEELMKDFNSPEAGVAVARWSLTTVFVDRAADGVRELDETIPGFVTLLRSAS